MTRLRAVLLIAMLGVLQSASAQPGDEPYIDLSGSWRVIEEDDARFAGVGWDDSAWDSVEVSGEGFSREQPVVWFRRALVIPPRWAGRALAISFATRARVEVWEDGERASLVGAGQTAADETATGPMEAGHYVIDLGTHSAGTSIQLALRSTVPQVLSGHGVQRLVGDGLFFGPRDVVAVTADVHRRELAQRRALPHILMAALFSLVGLFHVGLYWRRRELKAYLWYGIAILFLGAWEGVGAYDTVYFLPIEVGVRVTTGLARFAIASMVVFSWTLLRPGPRPRIVQVIIALNVIVGTGIGVFGFGAVVLLGSPYQDIVALSGLAAGMYVVVVASWKGDRSARIILMGLSLHVGFTLWGLADQVGLIAGPPDWFFEIGHLSTLVAMGVALADHFATALGDAAASPLEVAALAPEPLGPTTASLLAASTLGSMDAGSLDASALIQRKREPARDVLAEDTLVGRYVIRAWLGRGGMGVVYHAYDPDLARDVAIKLVAYGLRGDSERKRQSLLHREAVAMARCTHPNIITIYDVGLYGDDVFLAMEYLRGTSLREWQRQDPSSRATEILAAYLEAGRGVSAAHRAGIVHGDFKAANVMCTDDGRFIVVDFGIARPTTDDAPEVLAGVRLVGAGTPGFMAPELLAGGQSTAASDQYAFAKSLFVALFDVDPQALTNAETLRAEVESGALKPLDPDAVPLALAEALLRGMSTEVEDRFFTMDDFLEALQVATAPSLRVAVVT